MRAALVIAAKDLLERIRYRTAIIVGVVAPFGLAAIFALLLPGADGDLDLRYGYVDLDGTEIAAAFGDGPMAAIEEAGVATVVDLPDEEAARAALEDEIDAAAIIPAGFGEDVQRGDPATITVIGNTDAGFAIQILRSLATAYTGELDAIRLSVATV
ncbi:MAG: ABC transporter permease, partial [Candidatus Limnocylindria bacterium]